MAHLRSFFENSRVRFGCDLLIPANALTYKSENAPSEMRTNRHFFRVLRTDISVFVKLWRDTAKQMGRGMYLMELNGVHILLE